MDKTISIIGGAGFVGTNLCRLLASKQQNFEIIDIRKSRQFPEKSKIADVRDLQSLRRAVTGDIIINLAAVHRDDVSDRSEYYLTNVSGAENITKVCSEKGIKKIIFTSSVAVYGLASPGTDESGLEHPNNDYGKSKLQAEKVFKIWQQKMDGSLLIVRPTVIFGEGNRGNVFNLFNQIYNRRFIMVGTGQNKKSMAYIGNVVSFLDACIRTDQKQGTFNYVDTPNISMNELVTVVRKKLLDRSTVGLRIPFSVGLCLGYLSDFLSLLIRKKLPVSAIRVRKFNSPSEFKCSNSLIDNFKPPFTLAQGIEKTLESEFITIDPNREIFYTE